MISLSLCIHGESNSTNIFTACAALFRIMPAVCLGFFLQGASEIAFDRLTQLTQFKHPFLYDLHPFVLRGVSVQAPVMIVCHGYGDNYSLASHLHNMKVTNHHLVGFNFPDHDITYNDDHTKSSFETFTDRPLWIFICWRGYYKYSGCCSYNSI